MGKWGQLFCKTVTGMTFELYVDFFDTISKLKTKIREKSGLPEEQQRLIYAGKQLEDHRTMAEYGIG